MTICLQSSATRCTSILQHADARSKTATWKEKKNPDWFRQKDMLGMMLYIDNFAGNIKGVSAKLPYLKECNVNCLHLMPFLDTPKGRSDGGYAVADFRKVRPDLGSMKDLAALADKCHKTNEPVYGFCYEPHFRGS